MRKKQRTVVVIAAYNEEKEIKKVIESVSKFVNRIIIVDDGSIDRTSDIVRKTKKCILLRHAINLGQGAALQTGFEYAKKIKADIVVTYDADAQFKASEIPSIISPIVNKKADVVLGSRFLGRTINMPTTRYLVLKFGLIFTKLFSNIRLTDTHNGFRAFSKYAISKIEITHNRWAHPSDLIYQISSNKLKVVEVPVTVYYSTYSKLKGQSNMQAFWIPIELVKKALVGL